MGTDMSHVAWADEELYCSEAMVLNICSRVEYLLDSLG